MPLELPGKAWECHELEPGELPVLSSPNSHDRWKRRQPVLLPVLRCISTRVFFECRPQRLFLHGKGVFRLASFTSHDILPEVAFAKAAGQTVFENRHSGLPGRRVYDASGLGRSNHGRHAEYGIRSCRRHLFPAAPHHPDLFPFPGRSPDPARGPGLCPKQGTDRPVPAADALSGRRSHGGYPPVFSSGSCRKSWC
jgi:hypothetical protein